MMAVQLKEHNPCPTDLCRRLQYDSQSYTVESSMEKLIKFRKQQYIFLFSQALRKLWKNDASHRVIAFRNIKPKIAVIY